jgi:pilus assembly protein CpaF
MTTLDQSELVTLLEPILSDPGVMEILVDGYDHVYVERHGRLEDVDSPFQSNDHLASAITGAFATLGFQVDADCPIGDLRLPDGSRMNAVLPPVALTGPALVIRKFPPLSLTVDQLITLGSWNEPIVSFLQACVLARANIALAGGTGSGKTTLLNILARMIPFDERVIVVENATELRLPHRWLVRLESRPPDASGRGAVTTRDLIANAMRMRPDRIVLGETRAGEALDMLQAMSTGHDGSLLSLHAGSPRDAITRLELMCLMAGMELPLSAIREQIASAIQIITYQERLADGRRKVMKVTEVCGLEGDSVVLNDIFEFRQTGTDGERRIQGRFVATGYVPDFIRRIRGVGIDLPMAIFEPGRD